MARIYQARQRADTGRWEYAVGSDDEGWCYPTGYCAGWKEFTEAELVSRGMSQAAARLVVDDREKARPFKDRYHNDGHATAGEAKACHQRYELDRELRLHEPPAAPARLEKCKACGAWCAGFAEVGEFWHAYMCPEHLNAETVERLYLAPSNTR